VTTVVRRRVAIGAAALLGLVVAVALAILAGRLSTQHIGLAGERPAGGETLALPRPATVARPAVTAPARPSSPPVAPSPASEEHEADD